ncbi:MAG: hypothetical protein OEW18_10635 [Candidatus Aminicenantes bacterium]|nr:hypothetical protein [Candidatus Aminicenantes bacterium]
MRRAKLLFRFTAFLILGLVLLPLCSYSYIDLGSGSYIIQLIIAGFVGFSLSVRIFWKKIRIRFSKKAESDKTVDAE